MRHALRTNRRPAIRRTNRSRSLEPLESRVLLTGDVLVTVIHDVNGNGVRDAEDPALQGWTVDVDYNRNGALDAGEPSAVTNIDGDTAYRRAVVPVFVKRALLAARPASAS